MDDRLLALSQAFYGSLSPNQISRAVAFEYASTNGMRNDKLSKLVEVLGEDVPKETLIKGCRYYAALCGTKRGVIGEWLSALQSLTGDARERFDFWMERGWLRNALNVAKVEDSPEMIQEVVSAFRTKLEQAASDPSLPLFDYDERVATDLKEHAPEVTTLFFEIRLGQTIREGALWETRAVAESLGRKLSDEESLELYSNWIDTFSVPTHLRDLSHAAYTIQSLGLPLKDRLQEKLTENRDVPLASITSPLRMLGISLSWNELYNMLIVRRDKKGDSSKARERLLIARHMHELKASEEILIHSLLDARAMCIGYNEVINAHALSEELAGLGVPKPLSEDELRSMMMSIWDRSRNPEGYLDNKELKVAEELLTLLVTQRVHPPSKSVAETTDSSEAASPE